MNFHQSTEEIINTATAEQRIVWNSIFLQYGEKIGLQQFTYSGPIPNSEFLIYSAAKMYLGLFIIFGSHGAAQAPNCNIEFFNKANGSQGLIGNSIPVWDTTAAALKYTAGIFNIASILFSRIIATTYGFVVFNGYRLSI